MITQDALNAAVTLFQNVFNADPDFTDLEVLEYWPDPTYNPPHDLFVLHEGTEADALVSLGGAIRSTPTGNGMPYIPDWLMALYRQRPVTQQPGVTIQQAQDRMRKAKSLLSDMFKRMPDVTADTPQPLNLYGTVAEAGKLLTVRHPLTGPYESDGGVKVVRFSFLAAISLRSSVH